MTTFLVTIRNPLTRRLERVTVRAVTSYAAESRAQLDMIARYRGALVDWPTHCLEVPAS